MAKIVISEFMPNDSVSRLQSSYQTTYQPDLFQYPDQLQEHLQLADALIVRNKTQVDELLIGSAPLLQVVGRLGVGLDNIDLAACERRSITVYTAAGANATSVAEYVLASALRLRRWQCWQFSAEVARGAWPRTAAVGAELCGCCLGLLGLGQIARVTAKLFQALDVRVIAYDPLVSEDDPIWRSIERVEFTALLQRSDLLSLHVPLLASTRNIINADNIDCMKDGAIIINSSRGGIVDESALAAALRSGKILGAALDVFTQEPLGDKQIELFADLDNVLLSPHVAGLTEQSNARVGNLIAEKVLKHFGG